MARLVVELGGIVDGDALERAVALARQAQQPLALSLAGEIACRVASTRPALVRWLRDAFEARRLVPLLTTAHGADPALLTPEELADELRLDEEMLQLTFGVTLARRGAVDHAAPAALEDASIDFVLEERAEPCRVGERLVALPAYRIDLSRRSLEASARQLEVLAERGVDIASADGWASELTPPWLEQTTLSLGQPSPAAVALAQLTGWCIDAFGLRRVPGLPAAALLDEGWRLSRFPTRARLPLLRRQGLGQGRRAFSVAHELCDLLAIEARVPGLAAHATRPLPEAVWPTLTALAGHTSAAEPLARATVAYEELRRFSFVGALRWRALLTALRDAFLLLSAARSIDWSVVPEVESVSEPEPLSDALAPGEHAPLN